MDKLGWTTLLDEILCNGNMMLALHAIYMGELTKNTMKEFNISNEPDDFHSSVISIIYSGSGLLVPYSILYIADSFY